MDAYGKNILTVSQLNQYTKMLFDSNPLLSSVFVKGEISNFVNHRSGHFYFSLKDETGVLRAVMFKFNAARLSFIPENGMKVIARGRVSIYERDGVYQLYAEDIQPDGLGALYFAYEQLRKKLEAEGLFDFSHKRELPRMPMRVGIITSPTGAAIQDMKNIIGRRFPVCRVILYPSLVQGEGAAAQLSEGIKYFNREMSVDVIIIGRGGGSIEDLWAFNDEALARAVYSSQIPVVSAVGHESDYTICDFVADVRASTPSAAAELTVPEASEIKRYLTSLGGRMTALVKGSLAERQRCIQYIKNSRALSSPKAFLENKRLLTDRYSDRLDGLMSRIYDGKKGTLDNRIAKLSALNPLSVLSRGYSVMYKSDGLPVMKTEDIAIGDRVRTAISDGEVISTITEIKKIGGQTDG